MAAGITDHVWSLEEIAVLANGTVMKPPLWQWVLGLIVLVALFRVVRDGFDKNVPLSTTNRYIRVVGGSIWACMIILGMLFWLWNALR